MYIAALIDAYSLISAVLRKWETKTFESSSAGG